MTVIGRHHNNFGILRLGFAAAVVLSHAPELVDGSRTRELLTQAFGTLSFGEFGVDGFFLISGYLITQSFERSSTVSIYFIKRVARIYPAFVVASAVSIFLFAPLSGTSLSHLHVKDWLNAIKNIVLLQQPTIPAFLGVHYPVLNGAMWTIAYEFRCYLLIALIGCLGGLRHRTVVLLFAAALLLLLAAKPSIPIAASTVFYGNPPDTIRLTAAFLTGSAFYLYRDWIAYRLSYACASGLLLFFSMFSLRLAEPLLLMLGGYVIFWFAFSARPTIASSLTIKYDVSYGLYLYAWPIQSLFVFFAPGISPWHMFWASLLLSMGCGLLSWLLVEQRMQGWAYRYSGTGTSSSDSSTASKR